MMQLQGINRIWPFLLPMSLLLLSACTPALTPKVKSAPETNYMDSTIEIPSSLRKVSDAQCEDDIVSWKEGQERKEKYYNNGIFCFEYVGSRKDIMRKFGSNVALAGYKKAHDGVDQKGVGLQIFEILATNNKKIPVKEVVLSFRPKDDKVYVMAYYLKINGI